MKAAKNKRENSHKKTPAWSTPDQCEREASTPEAHCELCERAVSQLTIHHLIPRSQARRGERSELPTAQLCPACHRQLHVLFSNRDLKSKYAGIAELKNAPEMQKFLKWVSRQDPNKKIRVRR